MKTEKTNFIYFRLSAMLLLAALSLTSILTGCSVENDAKAVPLSEAHITDYAVVRGDHSGNAVLKQALVLKNVIEYRFGQAPEVSTDWNALTEDGESKRATTDYEILLGVTNRAESVSVNKELEGKQGYICRTVGSKIVITATTVALLEKAIEHFTNDCLAQATDGYLSAVIDHVYIEENTLYFNKAENSEMFLYLPVNASETMVETARLFSTAFEKLTGISMKTEHTRLFDNTVVCAPSEKCFPAVQEFSDVGWQVHADIDTGSLVLQGESEQALSYAVSALYCHLERCATESLAEETRLFLFSGSISDDAKPPFFPSVMGGSYLGSEQVSTGSSVHYFEYVTGDEFVGYQAFLSEFCGYKQLYTESLTSYLSENGEVKLILNYDRDKQFLTVVSEGTVG